MNKTKKKIDAVMQSRTSCKTDCANCSNLEQDVKSLKSIVEKANQKIFFLYRQKGGFMKNYEFYKEKFKQLSNLLFEHENKRIKIIELEAINKNLKQQFSTAKLNIDNQTKSMVDIVSDLNSIKESLKESEQELSRIKKSIWYKLFYWK